MGQDVLPISQHQNLFSYLCALIFISVLSSPIYAHLCPTRFLLFIFTFFFFLFPFFSIFFPSSFPNPTSVAQVAERYVATSNRGKRDAMESDFKTAEAEERASRVPELRAEAIKAEDKAQLVDAPEAQGRLKVAAAYDAQAHIARTEERAAESDEANGAAKKLAAEADVAHSKAEEEAAAEK